MKRLFVAITSTVIVGCATLTEEAMTPIAMSFSDGSNGKCNLMNKRGAWPTPIPAVVSVRKSDDALKYDCETDDGRKAFGSITSEMGGKIVASAVFLDFGITDAITDKHRKYADSYVIPMPRVTTTTEQAKPATEQVAPATEQAKPATEKEPGSS